jgi:YHS domain-containing protein
MPGIKLFLLSFITLTSLAVAAQDANRRVKEFNLENGIAISGFDPVAYFQQQKAVKGRKDIAASYKGVTYQFSSTENRQTFAKNPAAYEPQYGGWCAYAMGAKGEKVTIDPETFKILNGHLYLFYNSFFNNTLKSWNKDEVNLKSKADVNWNKIFHQ